MDPVRMNTPASAAAGPTVGANCRRGEQTYAMGRLMLGPNGRWRHRGGIMRRITHKHTHTRFTQVQGPREEVKPLLLLV